MFDKKISLRFPVLGGGQEQGLNHAGLETFKDNDIYTSLARECAQNTVDASVAGKVTLRFSLLNLEINKLPCLGDLNEVLTSCEKYWESDKKAKDYFQSAKEYLNKDRIKVLKISDFGTSGLTGSDADVSNKWYGLVRSTGVSNKPGDAGGSYGIGKNAPFVASELSTIYYSSNSVDGNVFQGVSMLVTHKNLEGKKTQDIGYIGFHDEDAQDDIPFKSLRDKDVPPFFRRDEYGTDIYVPAYSPAYKDSDWDHKLAISILNNFWLSIFLDKISFEINDIVIDKNNIDALLLKYKAEIDDFRFIDAYRNGQVFNKNFPGLGNVEFRIKDQKKKRTPQVMYTRSIGMTIGHWGRFHSRKPFSGVFVCLGNEGNAFFRKMEPPKHDQWVETRHEDGKKMLKAVKEWIKDCIIQKFPLNDSDSFDMELLSRYLPADDFDEGAIFPEDHKNQDNNDGFDSRPIPPENIIHRMKDVSLRDENGADDHSLGDGNDFINPIGGDGISTGGRVNRSGAGESSFNDKKTSVSDISFRSFFDVSRDCYHIVLRSNKYFQGKVRFAAEYEDGGKEDLLVDKVISMDKPDKFRQNVDSSFQLCLDVDEVLKVKIVFNRKDKMSLKVVL